MVVLSVATGGAFWMFSGDMINNFMRWRQFGSTVWRGALECPVCGNVMTELKFSQSKQVVIATREDASVGVEMICNKCKTRDGRTSVDGVAAQHVLRRMLAYQHYSGATEKRVREATHIIETAGSPEQLARQVASRSLRLDRLRKKENRSDAIALEIALNDEAESRLLELELDELEERWREEEELAAIVDGELTPGPSLEKLRRKVNSSSRIIVPGDSPGDG